MGVTSDCWLRPFVVDAVDNVIFSVGTDVLISVLAGVVAGLVVGVVVGVAAAEVEVAGRQTCRDISNAPANSLVLVPDTTGRLVTLRTAMLSTPMPPFPEISE